MATASEVTALTEAYRSAQARRAAVVAALVAQYWRTRVDVNSIASIERWLEFVVPKILAEHDKSATLGAAFGERLRRLEVPNAPRYDWTKAARLDPQVVRTSLSVTGPVAVRRKLDMYDKMTDPELKSRIGENLDRSMLLSKAVDEAVVEIAGATLRHVQNGGRQTLVDNALADKTALGWVRVTKADPCYFCVMLASRGLVYQGDSFAQSDPRFHGPGDVKVHDSCACTMKPVYTTTDPLVERSQKFEEMWLEGSTGSSAEAIRTFRNWYNAQQRAKS